MAFNPNQPRDADGKWKSTGASDAAAPSDGEGFINELGSAVAEEIVPAVASAVAFGAAGAAGLATAGVSHIALSGLAKLTTKSGLVKRFIF